MIRVGHGYDAHRFCDGNAVVLGGVYIPYVKGLLGHSDADVLTHAVCDALLGAAALGDIGTHFPDSDSRYRGISSLVLLKEVASLLADAGYRAGNIDATVLAEEPRLSPYTEKMRENIAAVLQIFPQYVSIKATTEEGMGFTGRKEGIAAHAVCVILSQEK